MRRRRLPLLIAVAAVLLSACASGGDPERSSATGTEGEAGTAGGGATEGGESAEPGGTLRIGRAYDLGTLDPALQATALDFELTSAVHAGLVRYKVGTVEIEPDLATDWEQNEDGTVWTFNLHPDAEFHHGYGSVTADDVAFSLNRLTDPDLNSPNAGNGENFAEVNALDDKTVEIVLDEPEPDLLGKLAGVFTRIVSRKAVEEKGEDFGQDPVGAGPFEFHSWEPGERLTLRSFDGYVHGKPALDEVVYTPIADATTSYNAFDAGDLDMIQVNDPTRFVQYEQDDSVKLSSAPLLAIRLVMFSVDRPPFDDQLVREAVAHAIDRAALLEGLFMNTTVPAESFIAPAANYHASVVEYEYDPERARALLEEAGYTEDVEVTFYVPNIDRFTAPAPTIQQFMNEAGFDVTIEVMETQSFVSEVVDKGVQMWIQSRSFEPHPDRDTYAWLHSSGIPSSNWGRVDDPELDAALDRATTSTDDDVRAEAFLEVQEIIAEEHYGYFIDHEQYTWAMQDHVEGFVADPLRSLRLENVSLNNQ